MTCKLIIEFPSAEIASFFMAWYTGAGEQDYHLWIEEHFPSATCEIIDENNGYMFEPNQDGNVYGFNQPRDRSND